MEFKIVKQHRIKNQVMSYPTDLKITAELLKLLPNTTLLEFGTGGGGWPVINNIISGIQFDHCYLVDNFSWAKEGFAGVDRWIDNEQDLKVYLQEKLNTTVDVINFDTIKDDVIAEIDAVIDRPLDIIRVDCIVPLPALEYIILKHLKPTGIVLFDDIKLNGGFERVQRVFYFLQNHGFNTVWFGEKEGCIEPHISDLRDRLHEVIAQDSENLPRADSCDYGHFLSTRHNDQLFKES